MSDILIIGAGQLGSRHLQGALKINSKISITVVDPFDASLTLAKTRADEVAFGNRNSSVTYTKEIPKNKIFEVCIIATSADVRANVTREALGSCSIRHIIFEKVLFQHEQDFGSIARLLHDKDVIGWVNCPRRKFSTYQALKKILDLDTPIEMYVSGYSWGMAGNAIHFIDLFSYLLDGSSLIVSDKKLSNEVLKSKRRGFYELDGSISFSMGIHSLSLSCDPGDTLLLKVKIKNGENSHYIDEVNGFWEENVNGLQRNHEYLPRYQSDLTGEYIEDLLSGESCGLVSFEESCQHHIPLLRVFRAHLSNVLNKELIECPIT